MKKTFLLSALLCAIGLFTSCNSENKMKDQVTKYFAEYMTSNMDDIQGWTIASITFDTIGTSQYYYEVGERYKNGMYGEKYQIEKLSQALTKLDKSNNELQIVASLDVHPQEEWYDPMIFYVGIKNGKCVSCDNIPADNLKKLCNENEYTIYSTVKDIVFDQYFDRMNRRLEQIGIIDRVDQLKWMIKYGKNNTDFYNGFVHHDLRAFFE